MAHGNLPEPGIFALLRCPVQQRDIEHAVNDGPSSGIAPLYLVPGPDKVSCRIEPSCQEIRPVHGKPFCILIPGKPPVGHRCWHEHKSHVMMQSIIHVKALFHFPLRHPGNLRISLFLRILIQKPHDSAPESVCPPVDAVVHSPCSVFIGTVVIIASLIRGIGNFIPVLFTDPFHFLPHLLQNAFRPCPVIFHFRFSCSSSIFFRKPVSLYPPMLLQRCNSEDKG